MAIAVFVFAMSLLLQVGESQETSGTGDSRDAEAPANAWAYAGTREPLAGLSSSIDFQAGWDLLVGSVANDQNYTFGSIESGSNRNVSGSSQSADGTDRGQANGAATAGTTMGTGFGGGAPGSNLDAAPQQEAVPVPESVFSVVLLVMALLSLLIVRYFVTVRRARTAAFR